MKTSSKSGWLWLFHNHQGLLFPKPLRRCPAPSLRTVTKDASSLGACRLSKVQQRQEIKSSAKMASVTFQLSDPDAEQGGCCRLRAVGCSRSQSNPRGPSKGCFREQLIWDVVTGNKLFLLVQPVVVIVL